MKNLIIVFLLAATIGLGAYSFHQHRQITELTQVQTQLVSMETELKAAQGELKERAEAAEKAVYEEKKTKLLQDTLAQTSAVAVKQSEQVSQLQESLAAAKTNSGGFAALFKDPAMKDMIAAQQKAYIGPLMDRTYGDLFKQLNLTPEQSAHLKELLQKKALVGTELGMAMLDGSLDATKRAELGKQIKAETDAYDEQVKQYLGEDNYKSYQDYEKGKADRMVLGQFREQLAGTGSPMNPEQEKQLVQVMQEERTGFKWTTDYQKLENNPGEADYGEIFSEDRLKKFADERTRLDEQVLARAKPILTADQYDVFKKFQDNQTQMQISAMKIASKMFQGFGTKKN